MNKRDLVIYRITTGILSAHMLFTVVVYFAAHDMVSEMFQSLGVSPQIIYPLAIAKVLGLIAIWSNKSRLLKELAYLGFAADFIMAISLHELTGDGGAFGPAIALVFLVASYLYYRRLGATYFFG